MRHRVLTCFTGEGRPKTNRDRFGMDAARAARGAPLSRSFLPDREAETAALGVTSRRPEELWEVSS